MSVTNEQTVKKRRTKGERTKHLILESAIAVLAQQGIKGATHRAIASHANIQLSLTTYYFKDIQELVQQAFELNTNNIISEINSIWQPIINLVDVHTKAELRKVSVRVALREKLAQQLAAVVMTNAKSNHQQLIVQQQLSAEAQVTASLVSIAHKLNLAQLQPCMQLVQYFSQEDIEVNAEILLNQIQQATYRYLLLNSSDKNDYIYRVINQILAIVIRIKP